MPKLDPSAAAPKGEITIVPAGRYVLALVWFKRKISGSGNDYLSAKYEIVAGPLKGKAFFTSVGLDIGKRGNQIRWSIWCEAVGVVESFELGSIAEGNANEGDEEIRQRFVDQAFVGEVEVEKNGQYTNNTISKILPPKSTTAEELDLIIAYKKTQAEERDDFGDPNEDADDAPHPATRANGEDDWDIPF